MAPKEEDEKTTLVSETADPCCVNCPEAFRIDRRLLPYKAQYFFFYAGIGSLLPFLSLYFKEFGLSAAQIGVILGVKPICGTISSPFWGVIGDKFRIRKVLLLVSIATFAIVFLITTALPDPTEATGCPQGLPPVANASETETELVNHYKLEKGWIYNENEVTHLFGVLFVLVIIGELFWSPSGALGDAALLSVLDESEMHKYSFQRSWGALAMAIFQLIAGAALQSTVRDKEICGLTITFTNYRVAVYIFAGVLAVAFVISSFFKFKYDSKTSTAVSSEEKMSEYDNGIEATSSPSVMENDDGVQAMGTIQSAGRPRQAKFSLSKFMCLLCSVHYVSWLLCICYMAFCNAIIMGYLFWYLEELGGDKVLMGVAGGVASWAEFLFYYIASCFINKLGAINVLYVSLITYALRFTNYAFMVNPWLVLPSEVLQGFTFATAWVAFTQHASDALPPTYLAAIFGTLHGIYYGLGQGLGFLIGGILVDSIGAKVMFTILIGGTAAVGFLFFLAQKLSVRPLYEYDDGEDEQIVVKMD